jgi:hypothetical protein
MAHHGPCGKKTGHIVNKNHVPQMSQNRNLLPDSNLSHYETSRVQTGYITINISEIILGSNL